MTRLIVALFAITGLCLFALVAIPAFSYEGKAVTDGPFNDRQRAPAVFAHDEHNEKAQIDECSICHHLYQNGIKVEDESSEDMSCSDCHPIETGFPTRPLMKAYHDLCKGCHLENKMGPITCGECHPWR